MIPRTLFIDELGRRGYTYKGETTRVQIYRQRGGVNRVMVRRAQLLDEQYVRTMMRQIDAPGNEIEMFLRRCKDGDG